MKIRYFRLRDILAITTFPNEVLFLSQEYAGVIRLVRFVIGEDLGGKDVTSEEVIANCRSSLLKQQQLCQLKKVKPPGPGDNLQEWLTAQIKQHGEKLAVSSSKK